MITKFKPDVVYNLWLIGASDDYCAQDLDQTDVSKLQRLFWRARSFVLMNLFGWWWCEVER